MPLTRRESVLEFERYHRAFLFPSALPQFRACLQPALSIRQGPSVSLVVSWNSDFRPWPGWSEQTTPLLEVSAYFGDAWTNVFRITPSLHYPFRVGDFSSRVLPSPAVFRTQPCGDMAEPASGRAHSI